MPRRQDGSRGQGGEPGRGSTTTEEEDEMSDGEAFEDRGEELTRAGLALVRACYTDEGEDVYADLVASWDLAEREEAWSLAAGVLLRDLAEHGTELGCGCGSAAWLDRLLLGVAGH
jgi:hypothetical protein